MIIHNFDQYSLEWWRARKGLPSASRAGEIITPTGRRSASAPKYLAELIADSMDLNEEEDIQTAHMARGLELEEDARDWFAMHEHTDIHQVGLVTNDDETACCSPDGIGGLFTDRGGDPSFQFGWECKVPMAKTHIGYFLAGVVPPVYLPQVHMSMVVSGVRTWMFQSYHPELESLIVVVKWNDYTDQVKDALEDFIDALDTSKDKLNGN
jgi:hypothetical protein